MNDGRETDKWLISDTVIIGTIMAALDISIVNVALLYMRGNLGASVEKITWVATGYILSNVLIMPLVAVMSARYGESISTLRASSFFLRVPRSAPRPGTSSPWSSSGSYRA